MIHHRQQLIRWLEKNVTDRVIQTALQTGGVECCGGFTPLFPSQHPGFVVIITSVRQKLYNIAVICDPQTYKLRWFRLKQIPWRYWVGDTAKNPVYQGDKPKVYQILKQNDS